MTKELERELYDIYRSFSQERIRIFVKQKYQAKIGDVMAGNTEKNPDELQEKILKSFMELEPLVCLLGYIDALEDCLVEQAPVLKEIFLKDPLGLMLKAAIDPVTIIITTGGAVPNYKLKEFITKARENGPPLEVFIKGLEDLIEEEQNKKK